MRTMHVAIVGGGLAGSLAAAMLGRRGYATAFVDPNETYRPDFRCEKLEAAHIEALGRTGLADEILPAAHRYRGISVARFGRLCERKPAEEYGIDYSALVNRVRALIPDNVTVLKDTVRTIATSPQMQTLTLASGETLNARLVVAANGLNAALLASMGMHRHEVSRCHSISLGFDVEPTSSSRFPFGASLTHFGEAPEHRVSYFTIFPLQSAMRANLFVYRELNDPWMKSFRNDPMAALRECMPGLQRITGAFKIAGPVKVRPTDLYLTENVRQAGIVLVGDAFATACPTSGTGASKAIVDVERLCNGHVGDWLATSGMDVDKVEILL